MLICTNYSQNKGNKFQQLFHLENKGILIALGHITCTLYNLLNVRKTQAKGETYGGGHMVGNEGQMGDCA